MAKKPRRRRPTPSEEGSSVNPGHEQDITEGLRYTTLEDADGNVIKIPLTQEDVNAMEIDEDIRDELENPIEDDEEVEEKEVGIADGSEYTGPELGPEDNP